MGKDKKTPADEFVIILKTFYDSGHIQLREDAPEKVRTIFRECLEIAVEYVKSKVDDK